MSVLEDGTSQRRSNAGYLNQWLDCQTLGWYYYQCRELLLLFSLSLCWTFTKPGHLHQASVVASCKRFCSVYLYNITTPTGRACIQAVGTPIRFLGVDFSSTCTQFTAQRLVTERASMMYTLQWVGALSTSLIPIYYLHNAKAPGDTLNAVRVVNNWFYNI